MKGGNRGKEWIICDEEREWSVGGYLNKSRVDDGGWRDIGGDRWDGWESNGRLTRG